MNESTGQLDASLFYQISDNLSIGFQGTNLTEEVIQTTAIINDDLCCNCLGINRRHVAGSLVIPAIAWFWEAGSDLIAIAATVNEATAPVFTGVVASRESQPVLNCEFEYLNFHGNLIQEQKNHQRLTPLSQLEFQLE